MGFGQVNLGLMHEVLGQSPYAPVVFGNNAPDSGNAELLAAGMEMTGRHDIRELTVAISFEGDFETAHTKGDNRKILPTDTMKNTVYALARQHPIENIEEFALHLIDHFLGPIEVLAQALR